MATFRFDFQNNVRDFQKNVKVVKGLKRTPLVQMKSGQIWFSQDGGDRSWLLRDHTAFKRERARQRETYKDSEGYVYIYIERECVFVCDREKSCSRQRNAS